MLIVGTFFSETNKHRTIKLYIATFPLSMHKLSFFFVNIGENLEPFLGINILINVKKLTHRKIIIIWKPIAQTLYINPRLFIMNKATSVQSFAYLGLVVSEKNVPKID